MSPYIAILKPYILNSQQNISIFTIKLENTHRRLTMILTVLTQSVMRAIQTILILMYLLYPFQTDNYRLISLKRDVCYRGLFM